MLQGLITTAKAMASFDAFRKGRKGDLRALIDELRENSRLCFHAVSEGANPSRVISKYATTEFDRLNRAGFDFNALKRAKIPKLPGIDGTDLASWPGKTTSQLLESIYEKIKDARSINEFTPENPMLRRRLFNIHKRILLLLRHIKS